MASEFTVRISELTAKATDLREKNSQLQTETTTMSSEEQTLCSGFEGDAKTNFHVQFMKCQEYMDSFRGVIERYAATLDELARIYKEADASASNAASK